MEDLVKGAYEYASLKHKDQKFNDNSGRPYIEHCKAVYDNLFMCLDENEKKKDILGATALLHDTLEDTDATYDELVNLFGEEVANNVLALTKNNNLPNEVRMHDSIERILITSVEAAKVKLADRITNISQVHPLWSYKKSRAYLEEANLICEYLGFASPRLREKLQMSIENYDKSIEFEYRQGGYLEYFLNNKILFAYDSKRNIVYVYENEKWMISRLSYKQIKESERSIKLTKEQANKIAPTNPVRSIYEKNHIQFYLDEIGLN